jgi:Flp pilus assembly protein TadD
MGEVSPPPNITAEQHNQRGRELFDSEDLEGAIREFQLAVEADPGNASYHCNLAVAYDEHEQDTEALAEYENTLRLDANDLTALLSLGYMYNENEEVDKAKESWNRVIQIAPDTAEAQEAQTNLDNLGKL